ncbi:MAG: PQQ-dependent sugar dehydrogenase [Burkholderiaceae bacterium]
MKPHALLAVVFLSAFVASACSGASEPVSNPPAVAPTAADKSITTTEVASGLSSPWSMAFLPDGRLLVTERAGNLRLVGIDGGLSAPLAGVPAVDMNGQGGLLGLTLGPDFANDARVFFAYTESAGGGLNRTAVASGRLTDTALTDVQVIFRQQPAVAGGFHFGSRLVFDRSDNLFVTLGERNLKDPAQALDNHLGKVVRLRADGSIPADNPFVGQAGALPEIYSYGHRNPQGLALHPQTGEPWISEHGPQGGDEINRVLPRRNYGWPRITHGVNYGSGTTIGEGTGAPMSNRRCFSGCRYPSRPRA